MIYNFTCIRLEVISECHSCDFWSPLIQYFQIALHICAIICQHIVVSCAYHESINFSTKQAEQYMTRETVTNASLRVYTKEMAAQNIYKIIKITSGSEFVTEEHIRHVQLSWNKCQETSRGKEKAATWE